MKIVNTLKQLKEAIQTALQLYAHCLAGDCDTSEIKYMLDEWATLSAELNDSLDAIL